MKIVVGIGNPGKQYAATRHNIGFMIVDRLAGVIGNGAWRKRFHAKAIEGTFRGDRVLLLKPDTYVNESGRAVGAAMRWCRTALQDIIVVCDDFNLSLGCLRVRGEGSSGGHNGLASVAAHLDSAAWPRLRVGIGSVEPGNARDHVLSTFTVAEREIMDDAVARAVRALEVWLQFGLARCQNEFNARPKDNLQDQSEEADA